VKKIVLIAFSLIIGLGMFPIMKNYADNLTESYEIVHEDVLYNAYYDTGQYYHTNVSRAIQYDGQSDGQVRFFVTGFDPDGFDGMLNVDDYKPFLEIPENTIEMRVDIQTIPGFDVYINYAMYSFYFSEKGSTFILETLDHYDIPGSGYFSAGEPLDIQYTIDTGISDFDDFGIVEINEYLKVETENADTDFSNDVHDSNVDVIFTIAPRYYQTSMGTIIQLLPFIFIVILVGSIVLFIPRKF